MGAIPQWVAGVKLLMLALQVFDQLSHLPSPQTTVITTLNRQAEETQRKQVQSLGGVCEAGSLEHSPSLSPIEASIWGEQFSGTTP